MENIFVIPNTIMSYIFVCPHGPIQESIDHYEYDMLEFYFKRKSIMLKHNVTHRLQHIIIHIHSSVM